MKTINTSSMIDTILPLKAVQKVRRPKIGRRVVCHHDSGGMMVMGGGGLAKLCLGKCMYSNFTCRLLKIRSKSGDSNIPRRLEACWLVSIALWMCYVGSHELALSWPISQHAIIFQETERNGTEITFITLIVQNFDPIA